MQTSPVKGDLHELGPEVPAPVLDATSNQSALLASPPVNPELVRAKEVVGAKKVGKNTFEILLFRVLTTALSLAIVVVQSRFLAPSGRGVFVLSVLSVSVFSRLLGQLGVAVTNHMGRPEYDTAEEIRPLVQRALLIGACFSLVGAVLIVTWGYLTPSVGVWAALAAALGVFPNVATQTISGVLLGLSRIRLWNYVQLLSPLLAVTTMSVVVVGFGWGVEAALYAWAFALYLTAAVAFLGARDIWAPLKLPSLTDALSNHIVRLALTMGGMQVIALIGYRVELGILQALKGVSSVGIYSIAQQAAESIWLITAAIATAVTAPVVRSNETEAVKLIKKALVRSLLYTVVVAAVVVAGAPFVIPFALGHAFSSAIHPLLLLMLGVLAYAPMQVLVVYLSVRRGKPHLSLIASLTAMLVTAATAVPLIKAYGASGAAVASTIGYSVGVVLALYFFKRLASQTPAPAPLVAQTA
jgi:O-antigen/teichoic acid export membrane protein